jgi:hypothetical protein
MLRLRQKKFAKSNQMPRAPVALLGTAVMQFSQSLWSPTSAVTFDLVRRMLAPLMPTLSADASHPMADVALRDAANSRA